MRTYTPPCHTVSFPEPAASFIASLDLAALNPFDLISSECVNTEFASYAMKVNASVIAFSTICFVIWETWVMNWCGAKVENRPRIYARHMEAFLGFTYAVYPTMSLIQLRGFQVGAAGLGLGLGLVLRLGLSLGLGLVLRLGLRLELG